MTCAFGRYENACVTAAALLGGHVRVGFENNARIEMHDAFGAKAETVFSDGHMARIATIEVFRRHFRNARIDPGT